MIEAGMEGFLVAFLGLCGYLFSAEMGLQL
jgi:hypothetical protein